MLRKTDKYVMMGRQTKISKYKKHLKPLLSLGVLASLAVSPLAFAISETPTIYVTDGGDSLDSNPGNGECSPCTLRAAIQEANANTIEKDVIFIDPVRVSLSRSGRFDNDNSSGDLDITSDITIYSTNNTVIDANGYDRVFHIRNEANVVMENITVTGGLLDDSQDSDGQRTGGKGIYVESGYLHLRNVEISRNNQYGGDSTYMNGGGALYVSEAARALIENSVITNNSAPGGGGIVNLGTTTIIGTRIENNRAWSENGGGVSNRGGYLSIGHSNDQISFVRYNRAAQGGGIYSERHADNVGETIISNTEISENNADRFGGGVYNTAPMTISNSAIIQNEAIYDGGGVYNAVLGNLDMLNTTISTNSGRSGGGIFNGREISLFNSTVYNNLSVPCTLGSGCGDSTNANGLIGGNQIAVYNSSTQSSTRIYFSNTLIANGSFSSLIEPACAGLAGYEVYLTSLGHNLEDGDSCNFIDDNLSTTPRYFDQINVNNVNLDDLTSLEAVNPSITRVHPLLAGSPAINKGDQTYCPLWDQRYRERDDGQCDIGAFEYGAGAVIRENLIDLKAIIQDNQDPTTLNDDKNLLAYTATIVNLSQNSTSGGVPIDITLPGGFAFAGIKHSTSGDSINCDSTPSNLGVIECEIYGFEAFGRADITISGYATSLNTLYASVSVQSSYDPFTLNNSDTEDTEVTLERVNDGHNFGGASGGGGGGGSLNPLFVLLMGGALFAARNRRK